MAFIVTAMAERHLDGVAAIEAEVLPDPWSRAMIASDLQAGHALVFVAVQHDEVIGYINSWLAADECTINRIACCKKKQRCGAGSLLLRHMLQAAENRGAHSCFLDVRSSNAVALAFYGKAGFQRCGLRKNYYSDTGEDAFLMRRNF